MHFEGIVFPGQGTQYIGMGKDFYEAYSEVRAVFEQASNALGMDLYNVCQNDPTLLQNTAYTQPCILTLEIAIYEILKSYHNLSPTFFAGHSLGEYAALVANNVMSLELAVKIVNYRGQLMQSNVTKDQEGSMAAIIMEQIPFDIIDNIVNGFQVDCANDNSNQQVVISGYKDNVISACNQLTLIFKDQSVKIIPLAVKAPFHSRYMQTIEPLFKEYLLQFQHQFNTNKLIGVVSNYHGGFYPDQCINTLINTLTTQISNRVKWRQNMQHLIQNTTSILEIGPAAPLRGFFKSIGVNIQSISNVKALNKVVEVMA